jgi:hypothetical protein
MLPKNFKDLNKLHDGAKIVICGCGSSLLDFKEHSDDFITIGVNDVPALFTPTYTLVTDHPNRFNDARKKIVNESKSRYLFSCVGGWRHPGMVNFKLGKKGCAHLDDPEKVDHFLNSPYTAVNIAYKLGAKYIGMIGVDFTEGHFYNTRDGKHSLDRMNYVRDIKYGYLLLKTELNKRGVEFYNLSKNSQIDTVPYMSIEDFKKL